MRTPRHHTFLRCALGATAASLAAAAAATAQVASDTPAALVVYPHIAFDSAQGIDTVVQLSNTADTPITALCVYEKAERFCGTAVFKVRLTQGQPLAWRAGSGLSGFPLDGVDRSGPLGQSNQGSFIPRVSGDPFEGSLLCSGFDETSHLPLGLNVLTGNATVERFVSGGTPPFDAAAYNAVGIRALPDATINDRTLVLGGASGSHVACPQAVNVIHLLDGAIEPLAKASTVSTRLIVVPCTQDLVHLPEHDIALQLDVTNEFEQHLATGHINHGCEQPGAMSTLDTTNPTRSIFSASVSGTLSAQSRLSANGAALGVLVVGIETHQDMSDPTQTHRAMFNAPTQGFPVDPDVLVLPDLPLPCAGDCNSDRQVTIDELLRCVNIGLATSPVGTCPACDADNGGSVTVEEIIAGVNNALAGCP